MLCMLSTHRQLVTTQLYSYRLGLKLQIYLHEIVYDPLLSPKDSGTPLIVMHH